MAVGLGAGRGEGLASAGAGALSAVGRAEKGRCGSWWRWRAPGGMCRLLDRFRPLGPTRREAGLQPTVDNPRPVGSVVVAPTAEEPEMVVYRSLEERQQEVVGLLVEVGSRTRRRVQEALGWSRSTTRKVLEGLIAGGRVMPSEDLQRSPFSRYRLADVPDVYPGGTAAAGAPSPSRYSRAAALPMCLRSLRLAGSRPWWDPPKGTRNQGPETACQPVPDERPGDLHTDSLAGLREDARSGTRTDEPPRLSRRPQMLRDWGYDEVNEEVFGRGP